MKIKLLSVSQTVGWRVWHHIEYWSMIIFPRLWLVLIKIAIKPKYEKISNPIKISVFDCDTKKLFSEFQAFVVQPVDDRWDQNEFKWSDVVVNSKYIAVSASRSGKELKLRWKLQIVLVNPKNSLLFLTENFLLRSVGRFS